MTKPAEDLEALLPLTPVVFHTLLTLVGGASHGYAIAREVEDRTGSRVRMGPGTLYGTLSRLAAAGLIVECDGPVGVPLAERRRTYRLSERGRAALRLEAQRLEADVAALRAKKVLG